MDRTVKLWNLPSKTLLMSLVRALLVCRLSLTPSQVFPTFLTSVVLSPTETSVFAGKEPWSRRAHALQAAATAWCTRLRWTAPGG
jgi:hypothetical protein